MPKLRVHNLAISLDGYAAGPNQSLDNRLGERGDELHEFMLQTKRFGGPGASEVDELHVAIVPVLFDAGERLFEPIGDAVHAVEAAEVVSSPESKVTHLRLVRR